MRAKVGIDLFLVIFESTIAFSRQRGLLDSKEINMDCTLIEACASDDKRSILLRKTVNRPIRVNRRYKDAGFDAKQGIRPGSFYKSTHAIDVKAGIITDCPVFNY